MVILKLQFNTEIAVVIMVVPMNNLNCVLRNVQIVFLITLKKMKRFYYCSYERFIIEGEK